MYLLHGRPQPAGRRLAEECPSNHILEAQQHAVMVTAKRDDCRVVITCPDHGPPTIESSYDEAYAIGPTID